MGRECRLHGTDEKLYKVRVGKPEGKKKSTKANFSLSTAQGRRGIAPLYTPDTNSIKGWMGPRAHLNSNSGPSGR
jgi:hypothetical protein